MLHNTLIALGAVALVAVLLLAQQRQVPARSGVTYRAAILSEDNKQLYLALGPCGGTIVTFHKPLKHEGEPALSIARGEG